MKPSDPMQRIIFRPIAVQRYMQGEHATAEPLAMKQPTTTRWYVLIAVCMLSAMAVLCVRFQQHSVMSLLWSADTAEQSQPLSEKVQHE